MKTRRILSLTALPLVAAPLLTALPQCALAQAIDLGEIVVTANQEETAARRVGATVEVVTEADLQKTGETRLIDYLARIAGVSVRTSGPLGTQAGISVRGASQNYVAVLVDGIDVTDPTGPQVSYDFGGLTTTDISRIEIVKGSQSALYGSKAVAGVVNITTRKATEEGLHHYFSFEGGSYNTLKGAYSFTSMNDRHDLAITLSQVRTSGYSVADENAGNTEADGYRATRLSFNGSYTLDNGMRIGASGFAEKSFGEYDPTDFFTGLPVDDVPGGTYTNHNRTKGLRLFAEFTAGAIENTLSFSYFDVDRTITSYYAPIAFKGSREVLEYKGATDVGTAGRLVFGADLAREKAADNGTFNNTTRVAGLFSELTWALSDRLDLTASLRHDEHSVFGGYTTGRGALAWRLADDLTLRASAGNGYRAPSNYELAGSYGFLGVVTVIGNPNLTPETSRSADIGIEKTFGERGHVRATAFWLEVDNLIYYDFGLNSYQQAGGLSRRKGIELEGQFPLGEKASATLSYTYTDSSQNGSSLWVSVPRNRLGLSLAAALTPRLNGVLSAVVVGGRTGLPGYSVVNTTFTYDMGNRAEAYIRVENLFNAQYELVNGYGTSDRAIYAGLRKSF